VKVAKTDEIAVRHAVSKSLARGSSCSDLRGNFYALDDTCTTKKSLF
jgi:hypothetical protein